MNELTIQDRIVIGKSFDGYIKGYNEEDVILAVEETIKRIEEQCNYCKYIMDKFKTDSPLYSINTYKLESYQHCLQIIKEQFPIIETEKVEK